MPRARSLRTVSVIRIWYEQSYEKNVGSGLQEQLLASQMKKTRSEWIAIQRIQHRSIYSVVWASATAKAANSAACLRIGVQLCCAVSAVTIGFSREVLKQARFAGQLSQEILQENDDLENIQIAVNCAFLRLFKRITCAVIARFCFF